MLSVFKYIQNRTNQRHIDSWGVRGHWRTYKNGNRIWIKPQIRGDKTKESSDKEYRI